MRDASVHPPEVGPGAQAPAAGARLPPGSRSRDVIVLVGCLVAFGSTALFLWAGIAEGLTTVWIGLPFFGGPIPSTTFLAASAGILVGSLAGILLLRRGSIHAARPHDLLPLIALLSFFALLETARLLHPDEATLLLSAVQVNVVPLVVLWIFYRRPEPGDAVLLIGGWLAALLATRPTMAFIFGSIDAPRAALHTRVLVGAEELFFAALCVLPLAMLSGAVRARLMIWRARAERLRLTLGVANLLLGGLVLWQVLRFSERAAEMLFLRAATQGFAITLVVIVLRRGVHPEIPAPQAIDDRRREWAFPAVLLGMCLGYIFLAARVTANWPMDNYPDTVSYLSIARQYAEGTPVIRGYWSPLAIWLMIPLLRYGLGLYAAYHAVAIAVGLAWILVSAALARLLGLGRGLQLAVAGSVGFLVIGAGLSSGLPDLTGALFLAIYFCVLLSPRALERPIRNGALAGVVGAVAYLAKYYNLGFILLHLGVTCALRLASGAPRKAAAKAFVSAALTLLAASLPWAVTLSLRYNHLTFNTTGALARAIVGPRMTDHPCNGHRLCTEPNDVLFSWEDPDARYYPDLAWSPLASVENLQHALRLVADHLRDLLPTASFYIGLLPALGLVGVALLALKAWQDPGRRFLLAWITLTVALYVSGYLFFPTTFRYHLSVTPLLFVGVYLTLTRLTGEGPPGTRGLRGTVVFLNGALAVALALVSMARLPVLRFYLTEPSPYTCLETDSLALAGVIEAPFAGTDSRVLHVSFFTRTRLLGWLGPDGGAAEADQELRANSVRSFLVGDGTQLAEGLIRDYGYTVRASVVFCQGPYLILLPPPSN